LPWKPKQHTPHPRAREKRHGSHDKSTTERGYGWDWQCFRATVIRERPICEWMDTEHPGIVKPSIELHHLTKIKHAPDRRLDPENVVALCEQCHDAATARGE
jgi:5-methylcytosine-specific restriction endonuclease McrA